MTIQKVLLFVVEHNATKKDNQWKHAAGNEILRTSL